MNTAVADSGLLNDLESVLSSDLTGLELSEEAAPRTAAPGAEGSPAAAPSDRARNQRSMTLLDDLLDSTGRSDVDIQGLTDLLGDVLNGGSLEAPAPAPRQHRVNPGKAPEAAWKPGVDVRDEAGRYVILVDAPGAVESSLDVAVDGKDVSISGIVAPPVAVGRGTFIRHERADGPFARTVTLPAAAKTDQIRVFYTDGVIVVVLEKLKTEKPTRS
jgi:HSP20 family protein